MAAMKSLIDKCNKTTYSQNCVTNKTYDEIKVGDSATLTRTLTK